MVSTPCLNDETIDLPIRWFAVTILMLVLAALAAVIRKRRQSGIGLQPPF